MLCVGLVVNVNYILGNKDYKYKCAALLFKMVATDRF
jgi:hypothetical protein